MTCRHKTPADFSTRRVDNSLFNTGFSVTDACFQSFGHGEAITAFSSLMDSIIHPCPNFNGGLIKSPLKLHVGPGWVIASHKKLFVSDRAQIENPLIINLPMSCNVLTKLWDIRKLLPPMADRVAYQIITLPFAWLGLFRQCTNHHEKKICNLRI